MPQSLASIYLHAVFSTKNRYPLLIDESIRSDMHAYLAAVTKRLDCPAIEIGGADDHVHLLVRFGRGITVSDWMKELKRVSSAFGKAKIDGFAWQAGYGVFSVHADQIGQVAHYIGNQQEHHRVVSFKEEFLRLLGEHGLAWDERYIWD